MTAEIAAEITPDAHVQIATADGGWSTVCRLADLIPGRGVAALVDGEQVAVFLDRDGTVYAVGNLDPFSGAQVISRGIVGSRGDVPVVMSPMYKEAFDLRTGLCLDGDDEAVALPVHEVRVRETVAAEVG
ncbi:MAG TPA: nitrite reductase small subunit NirD [Yinghuangia sp.]|uniref:nitrite reductase small subunit NirD n=1 Tax=Yinghuangia sp. YIM S10712 TaxID=3436930 RepID=UPI002B6127B6|nr:nitrite reductase small subunit NirD [Yinghuangia sp.]